MPTRPVLLPPEPVPIIGMRDSLEGSVADPRFAILLENCYPLDPSIGSGVVSRPGYDPAGSGFGLSKDCQWIGQFVKSDGTEKTLAIVEGELFEWNWSTSSWGTAITLGGGAALPTSGFVYAVSFNDQLVVNPNDGTNKPWMWDGTTFTLLSNAPLAYGKPVVYFGKLFLIKWAARNVIAWSEEYDATTGYETAPFNNAWKVTQTSPEPFVALAATNIALYYFRPRSIGVIYGAVTPEFKSDGVQDAVSTTVGTAAPDGVTFYDDTIYFMDADARVHRLRPGGALEPLWADARETSESIARVPIDNDLTFVQAIPWSPGGLVLFAVRLTQGADRRGLLAWQHSTGRFAGVWKLAHRMTRIGATMVHTIVSPALPQLIFFEDHSLNPSNDISAKGYILRDPEPTGVTWGDAGVSLVRKIEGMPLGYDERWEKHFDLIDMVFRAKTALTDLAVQWKTPDAASAGQGQLATLAAGLAPTYERHHAVGLDADGRWLRPQIEHAGAGEERFWFLGWQVTAYPTAPYPGVR